MQQSFFSIFSNCYRKNKYTVKISTPAMGEKGKYMV